MVIVLLVMTLATATTGLFSATRQVRAVRSSAHRWQGLGDIHGTLGNLMISW